MKMADVPAAGTRVKVAVHYEDEGVVAGVDPQQAVMFLDRGDGSTAEVNLYQRGLTVEPVADPAEPEARDRQGRRSTREAPQ